MPGKPLIGITADYIRVRDIMPASAVYEVYSTAVIEAMDALPWLLPPLGHVMDMNAVLDRLDGIVFTGSRTNIEAHHYNRESVSDGSDRDPARDSTTLPLIPRIIEQGIPMFCICRGFQELNVALGGTLQQQLFRQPGLLQHLPPEDWPPEQRFALSHEITLEKGGLLAGLANEPVVKVNSVHGQGIDELSPGLVVEARAEDGVIEAVQVRDSRGFALGVQWHPEWDWREHELDAAIWSAFAEACH